MGDDGSAVLCMLGHVGKRCVRACKSLFIRFAAGRTGGLSALAEIRGVAIMQLIKCKAVPLAAVKLDELRQNENRADSAGDSLRRLTRAKKRTGIHCLERKRFKEAAKRSGLFNARSAQRQIILLSKAHHLAAGIGGLGMPDEI